MRPTGLESIRAIQAALTEIIVPELPSPFAQDAAGTVQMLLESLAREWDTAADELRADNEFLCALLSAAHDAMAKPARRNESLSLVVTEIEGRLREGQDNSVTLATLASRNDALWATLERVLVAIEDVTGGPGSEDIDTVRQRIYVHLRRVATRGWSFWDISSFRGRMAALRSAAAVDDAR